MVKRFIGRTVRLAGVGLLVAVGLTFQATVHPTSSQQGPTVSIEDGQAPPAGTDVTRLSALGVSDPALCGFAVDVEYDRDVTYPMGCAPDPEDKFDVELCNPYYWADSTESVRVVAGTGSPEGVTGDIPLADITWCALGSPGESSDLHVEVVSLSGCEVTPAEIAPVAVQDGVNVIGTGTAPVGTDRDGDGFSDCAEMYLGTDGYAACPYASWHDAWPLDQDNNGTILVVGDVTKFGGNTFKAATDMTCSAFPHGACKRLDLDANGMILVVGDVTRYTGKLFETCQ